MSTHWYMPAEWAPHQATWMIWPDDQQAWPIPLDKVQHEYWQIAQAISQFEPVKMLVDPRSIAMMADWSTAAIQVIPIALNDSWSRDSLPTFVCHQDYGIGGVSWQFNGWGGKQTGLADRTLSHRLLKQQTIAEFSVPLVCEGGAIHVDGEGTLITTESVLLNRNRNPGWTKRDIERVFTAFLGIKKVIWLPGDPDNVSHDFTDGHVDGICAFARPATLLIEATYDSRSEYARVIAENRRALAKETDAKGRPFQFIELFEASSLIPLKAEHYCASYVNFYLVNGGVIMPEYGIAADHAARKVLQQVFPRRRVVGVSVKSIAYGGGGVHCITQQQPAYRR